MKTSSNIPIVSISIVSHLQADMVCALLAELDRFCKNYSFEVIITHNLPEKLDIELDELSFPVVVRSNNKIQGFGENHNKAFGESNGHYFCVMNPDIHLNNNPFEALLAPFLDVTVGMVAPSVLGADGTAQDSARQFPTVTKILKKIFSKNWQSDYALQTEPVNVDWAAGMFMLFSRSAFKQVIGFNERYFLYYEDVDICARLHLAGFRVLVCPSACVVHHAQHSSHRSLKYLRWHLTSLIRFLTSPQARQLRRMRRP